MFTNTQIQTDTLPKFETIELKAISPKYKTIVLINVLIAHTLVFALLLLAKYFFKSDVLSSYFWIILLILIIFCICQVVLTLLNFRTRKYGLREKDIMYSAGYITNKTTTLPFNRVQHIEISRSFLARKFNLSTLKIYSAGESGGDISIAGLPNDIAQKQYAFLIGILNERL